MEIAVVALAGIGAATVIYWLIRFFARRKHDGKALPKLGTMDLILIVLGVSLVLFTVKMISLYETYMAVPDTLITCVFAICGGECGVMGWIRTNKDNNKMRKWQLEDQEREKEEQNNQKQ